VTSRVGGTGTTGRRRVLALGSGLVATALMLGVLAVMGPAGAEDAAKKNAPQLTVQQVAATGDNVVVTGSLVNGDPSALKATVDGTPVDTKVTTGTAVPLDVVVVLDNSAPLGNATVQLAKQALAPLMPGAGVVNRLGLVTTGGGASVEVGSTTSAETVQTALDGVDPVGQSATWDGLVLAGNLLKDEPNDAQKAVVMFDAGPNGLSAATPSRAETALRQAGAQLDAVVIQRGADVDAINGLVAALGGMTVEAPDEEALDTSFQKVADQLGGRFRMTYPAPPGNARVADLTVTAGSASTTVEYMPGSVRAGSANLAPPADEGGGILNSLTDNSFILWGIVLLGVVAIVLFVWTLLTMLLPDDDDLVRRLKHYEDPYGEKSDEDDIVDTSHTTVPIIKRAVDFTGDMAERRGVLEKLEGDLERANLPLRGAEAMFFVLVGAVLLGVLALALTRNPIMALVAVALGIVLPKALLNFRVRRRQKAFEAQLPDMLTLMAGTLRAGYSIGQGFEAVSHEIDDPMGRELRRVVTENRLGRPLEEALDAVAERMQSDDFGWAVMAIRIQREVGGNLAELLLTVANTMTQRERLRRDVATLTAEGRVSALVLGVLPPGLGLVMYVMNPEYISKLFEPGLGYILIGMALVAMFIGFAWMKKIITIEV
jgi:tight adherence protein B